MFLRQLAKLHLSVLKEANQWYDQSCSSHAGAASGMYGKKLLSKARLLRNQKNQKNQKNNIGVFLVFLVFY